MDKKAFQMMVQQGFTSAQRLMACGLNVNALRTNATLREDEWKAVDTAVLKVAQERLVGVADLMARNLVYNVSNGLGKTVLQYEDISDVEEAQLSMDAVTAGKNDRVVYSVKYLPLPVISADWQLNIRVLNASRTTGDSLDTSIQEAKARKIAEKMEDMLFNGASTFAFGGGTLYGYLDAPGTNGTTLSQKWDAGAATGETILDDVRALKQASIDAKHYGPWMIYVPTRYETPLDDDFKANSDKTIRQRIREVTGIVDVKVADKMPATDPAKVILVQMTSDVVRWVQGLPLQNIEWEEKGGLVMFFKTITIAVPQIRADQEGNSGIVIGSKA